MCPMLLALDTATDAVCTALVDDDGRALAEAVSHAPGGAARRVLADVDHVLAAAGASLGDLRRHRGRPRPGLVHGRAHRPRDGRRARRRRRPAAGRRLHAGGAAPAQRARCRRGDRRPPARGLRAAARACRPRAYAPADLAARLARGHGLRRATARCATAAVLEAAGAAVPADGSPLHLPLARAHAALARFDGARVGAALPARARRRARGPRPSRADGDRHPPAAARRPGVDRAGRAPRLPDAVVAHDVRRRDRQADVAAASAASRATRSRATSSSRATSTPGTS